MTRVTSSTLRCTGSPAVTQLLPLRILCVIVLLPGELDIMPAEDKIAHIKQQEEALLRVSTNNLAKICTPAACRGRTGQQ